MALFIERKLRLDGTELVFECTPIHATPRLAIGLFRSPSPVTTAHFSLPAGALSYGFFWSRRPYVLYRISGSDLCPIGYRIDVVDNVCIAPLEARYRDLVLDVWVDAGGSAVVEDRDELADLVAQGRIDRVTREQIERVAERLVRTHPRITAEVERELVPFLGSKDG